MAAQPISVRLEADVRAMLEADAEEHHIGLATYLRNLAAERAKELRKERIRVQSAALARRIAASPEISAFYEDWGSPMADIE